MRLADSYTVTVTFNQAVTSPGVRVLEYRGVNRLDVKAGTSGKGNSANSGAASPTTAKELTFGANIGADSTEGPGGQISPPVLSLAQWDIAEDRIVSATGSYSATASLSGGGAWLMQKASFK